MIKEEHCSMYLVYGFPLGVDWTKYWTASFDLTWMVHIWFMIIMMWDWTLDYGKISYFLLALYKCTISCSRLYINILIWKTIEICVKPHINLGIFAYEPTYGFRLMTVYRYVPIHIGMVKYLYTSANWYSNKTLSQFQELPFGSILEF